uniref:rRNA adenine N(6)-methyltransferase n=1 Tax=Anopheles culicifacies TaxID=139723 RepID=A0A182M861_9DIPT
MSSSEGPKSEFKIEGTGRTLKKTEVDFMRLIEQQNLQRVQKLQRQRRNNKLTGIALGGTVLGIYLYSMFSVKQEKFLDDFEEPVKLEVENKALTQHTMASATRISKALTSSGVRLPPLPTIRDLVKLYQLRAIKQLSQNFLMDERLTDKIVRAAGNIRDHYVLEVGPGPGGITRSIIRQNPRHLVVVEKDRRFMPTMEMLAEVTQPFMRMDIVQGDILNYRIEEAFPDCPPHDWMDKRRAPVHLIGNLPFAISTRLLINWLRDMSLRTGAWSYGRASLTLTFQKEVAERIVAPILSEQRCRLSVMNQIWSSPDLRFMISGRAFVPKPQVDVGVVTIVPLQTPLTQVHFDTVEKVIRHIFSMRQKYCRRGVSNLYPPAVREELTELTFKRAEVDPLARSFQLSVAECLRIVEVYDDLVRQHPEIASYDYRAPKVKGSGLESDEQDSETER